MIRILHAFCPSVDITPQAYYRMCAWTASLISDLTCSLCHSRLIYPVTSTFCWSTVVLDFERMTSSGDSTSQLEQSSGQSNLVLAHPQEGEWIWFFFSVNTTINPLLPLARHRAYAVLWQLSWESVRLKISHPPLSEPFVVILWPIHTFIQTHKYSTDFSHPVT